MATLKCKMCGGDLQIAEGETIAECEYEGDNNTFIWKHPVEDFNYGSQLIVHESQEAIFFRDGQAQYRIAEEQGRAG